MPSVRPAFRWPGRSDPVRSAARLLLKSAKRGDREQYLSLAANYIDFTQYFLSCISGKCKEKRITLVALLFNELWKNLPYVKRLSDFEFMLATALIEGTRDQILTTSSCTIINRIRSLSPQRQFIYLAHTLGNWPLRWIALATRSRPSRMHRILSEIRCELCATSWEALKKEEKKCLEAISVELNNYPNVQINKSLCKRTLAHPRVMEIKANWLELRAELVEIRIRNALDPRERESLLSGILDAITDGSMKQPALIDRMLNVVQFSRHAKIKVS